MAWKVKANDRPYHHLPEFQKKIFLCFKKSRYSVRSTRYTKLFGNSWRFHSLTWILTQTHVWLIWVYGAAVWSKCGFSYWKVISFTTIIRLIKIIQELHMGLNMSCLCRFCRAGSSVYRLDCHQSCEAVSEVWCKNVGMETCLFLNCDPCLRVCDFCWVMLSSSTFPELLKPHLNLGSNGLLNVSCFVQKVVVQWKRLFIVITWLVCLISSLVGCWESLVFVAGS